MPYNKAFLISGINATESCWAFFNVPLKCVLKFYLGFTIILFCRGSLRLSSGMSCVMPSGEGSGSLLLASSGFSPCAFPLCWFRFVSFCHNELPWVSALRVWLKEDWVGDAFTGDLLGYIFMWFAFTVIYSYVIASHPGTGVTSRSLHSPYVSTFLAR